MDSLFYGIYRAIAKLMIAFDLVIDLVRSQT
jgi:hypothetical protein